MACQSGKTDDQIGDKTVIELHQRQVVDEVFDQGRCTLNRTEDGGTNAPSIKRPGVVGEARFRAGDEAAQHDLEQDQAQQDRGDCAVA